MRRLLALVVLAAAVVFGVLVRGAARAPDGPQPIAYDREPCAHCHMLIGEPAFAGQVVLADGHVLDFDDPGCLLAWLAHAPEAPARIWFHDHDRDRWLSGERAGFVATDRSPMGWRLAAVDGDTPGAIPLAEARRRIAGREAP